MNCSFGSESSPCKAVGSSSQVHILPLNACRRDVTNHLVSLGISAKRGWLAQSTTTEKDLILNRSGKFDLPLEQEEILTICSKHRLELTLDWPGRKRSTCGYPIHTGVRKQIRNPRRVNLSVSREIYQHHGVVVPAGTGEYFFIRAMCFI